MKTKMRSIYALLVFTSVCGGLVGTAVTATDQFIDEYTIPFVDPQEDGGDVYSHDADKGTMSAHYETPTINIDTLSFNEGESQLEVSFTGTPNLSPAYGYRLMIAWDEYIGLGCTGDWWEPNWDLELYTTTNVTLCVAGGASWFGVHNGSYNSFVNSNDESIFFEATNSSAFSDGHSLCFPVNTTYFTHVASPAEFFVYTTFTWTITENGSSINFDGMPNEFLYYFAHITFAFNGGISFPYTVSLFLLAGLPLTFLLKKKR
ncbi:MAG: hypothetical protein JXA54_10645 [Candidatus Heimdallarchaeota archaeon]|nr:hypothetical protein [Candidatus Heimdallarchaeota archaeon]